jgi:hypothetical protein
MGLALPAIRDILVINNHQINLNLNTIATGGNMIHYTTDTPDTEGSVCSIAQYVINFKGVSIGQNGMLIRALIEDRALKNWSLQRGQLRPDYPLGIMMVFDHIPVVLSQPAVGFFTINILFVYKIRYRMEVSYE